MTMYGDVPSTPTSIHREDVGMIQAAGGACLLLEAAPTSASSRERRRQHLDRDVALQLRIARPVDLAHSTGAQRAEDFEAAEAIAHRESH